MARPVISALNRDLSYDEFVRGNFAAIARRRRTISAAGHLTPVDPRPEIAAPVSGPRRNFESRLDQQLAIPRWKRSRAHSWA